MGVGKEGSWGRKDGGGRRTFAEKLEQTEQEVGGGQGERGQALPGLYFFRFRGEKRRRRSLDFVEKKLEGAEEQRGERRSRRRSKAGEEKMMRCC